MSQKFEKNEILLVGAGYMATEYAKVLKAMRIKFTVIGNSQVSAEKFALEAGIQPITGGIEKWVRNQSKIPSSAIIATNVETLGKITRLLLKKGVKNILLEKPGGLEINNIKKTAGLARSKNAGVYIAYNRRFYASTAKAGEIIKQDGGLLSVVFEFTEWSNLIERSDKSPLKIKKHWLTANSSHVIDLAFYVAGWPKLISSYKLGRLAWHPSGAIFGGAGITEKKAVFSYHANWQSAGRWGIEFMTIKNRLILRPLEKLFIQKRDSLELNQVEIDDELDKKFKPGLYKQVESFLGPKNNLVTVNDQLEHYKIFESINKGLN